MLKPAKRYRSKNFWSSGVSLSKEVWLKLPSILTPQVVQDIAAVCIGKPQEGHDVESILFLIPINISIPSAFIN
jgi:hypothetical protein